MPNFMLRINVHQIKKKWNQCKDKQEAFNNKYINTLACVIEKE